MRTKTNRYGFTLVELSVVMAILGILSVVILAGDGDSFKKGYNKERLGYFSTKLETLFTEARLKSMLGKSSGKDSVTNNLILPLSQSVRITTWTAAPYNTIDLILDQPAPHGIVSKTTYQYPYFQDKGFTIDFMEFTLDNGVTKSGSMLLASYAHDRLQIMWVESGGALRPCYGTNWATSTDLIAQLDCSSEIASVVYKARFRTRFNQYSQMFHMDSRTAIVTSDPIVVDP